jgi:histidinol-phosphate/aromatic aminotransferase/cobyric acid decarboxylase-like protein
VVNIVKRKRLKFKDDYTYLGRNMIMDEHPEHIHKSLLEYFKKEDLHQYPSMWKLHQVLSNYLNVSEEKLLITRGVEGAFKQVFETLVDKGDSVGILTPTCAMYHVYSEVYGVKEIHIQGEAPDYTITVEQIKKVVPKIKVLFLDNPKSHIPSSFNENELREIIDYCEKHEVIVFLDEVYIGWEQKSYLPNLSNHKNLIISQSFSKIAFASLRVGWLVANKDLKKKIESLRDSYELNYFACKSIEFIIDNQDYINELKKNILDTKKRWHAELSKGQKLGFKVYNSKSYVLRLYSEDKEFVRRTYDQLYSEKIIVNIVDDVNLVFSVSNNKKIWEIFTNVILKTDINNLRDTNELWPTVMMEYEKSNLEDGWFRRYWENGHLRYEWEYKDGKRADGISTGWHKNGKLKQTITYKNGKKNGLWTKWYENGQKKIEERMKDGKNDGLWTMWTENGKESSERIYKDGEMISSKTLS